MLVPSRDEFLSASNGRPAPVYRDLLADVETPVSAYWKLARDEPYSFLLESVTGGEQLARYSILGVRPKAVLRAKGRNAQVIDASGCRAKQIPMGQDPLHLLEEMIDDCPIAIPGLPKFAGGAVGMLGYDIVRFFERLPDSTADDLQIDDLAMMIADSVVVFDHAKNTIRVIVNARSGAEGYDRAVREIERLVELLKSPLPPLPDGKVVSRGDEGREHGEIGGVASETRPVKSSFEKEAFLNAIAKARRYIAEGDCIQTVIAQRFETEIDAHPLTVYRSLRSLNPSPYMFLLRFGDFDVVGASPEILVSLEGRTARERPIAGTRWRGGSPEEDDLLARELLNDEKELAEHIMLVDLGRNDLGRVCTYGSVTVNELMTIERYSHVMHIVSDVTGTLNPDEDAFSLLRATFPAGTVSGAPKVRAMEIIDELEPTRRGLYAGAVGYISTSGDMDMCIAIRTILMKDGKAYVQAGGGIVYDSNPEYEYRESCNKAKACLKALELAQAGLDA